jgi:hypothetical protein
MHRAASDPRSHPQYDSIANQLHAPRAEYDDLTNGGRRDQNRVREDAGPEHEPAPRKVRKSVPPAPDEAKVFGWLRSSKTPFSDVPGDCSDGLAIRPSCRQW